MEAFEELVADIFRARGYWVHPSYKITLTREEKRALGNPNMPRPEIDLVAYRPASDELLALECKSYFDSGGVHAAHFDPTSTGASRYKMFTRLALRKKIMAKLVEQLDREGCLASPLNPQLGMVFGHATPSNAEELDQIFERNRWALFGPDWIRTELREMADRSYDNKVAAMVAKLLLR